MSEFGGEVTNPKIFIRNKTITRDGLLSEQIFGPIRSYTCACGKFNESLRTIYEGQTCDKCGVKCISNEARLTTFGKITLAFPVIKPTKRKKFKSIVGKDEKHLLDPEKAEISASLTRYLAITPDGQRLFITDNFSDENNYIVPLRITGLYSFILSLKYVANYLGLEVAKSLFTNNYIMEVIKVLPPDIRPIVKDPKKPDALRVTEVNKPYVQLLQLNKANEVVKQILPDKEADWLSQIHYNFKNQLDEEIVDQLIIEYDKIAARYQYCVNKVYDCVFESISGKYGYIRYAMLGKTIEFSARSVITINPSLEPYKVKVSKRILYKLWFPYFLNYIKKKYPNVNYVELYDKFVTSNYEQNKEYFNAFLDWFLKEEKEEASSPQIIRKKIIKDDD